MIPDSLIDEVKKLMNYTADQPAKVCENCHHRLYDDDNGYVCNLNPVIRFQVLPNATCDKYTKQPF